MTPGNAADALGRAIAAAIAAHRQALADGAEAMRAACSDAIGRDGGPNGDWDPLRETTVLRKRQLHQLGRVSPQDQLLATGTLQASYIVDGADPDAPIVTSTDPVAAYHELGTADVPPRPVMAPIAARMGEGIARQIGQAVADAFRSELDRRR